MSPRTALVHDWVEKVGGSEKVLDRLAASLPGSDLITLWSNDASRYPDLNLCESWLARSPFRGRKSVALPFMSSAWRGVDLRGYDRVVISTHSFAHHVGSGLDQGGIDRFVYVHSPPRWIWARDLDARGNRALALAGVPALKRLDRSRVSAGSYVANSRFIADRVRSAWEVEADVIYPPVDTSFMGLATEASIDTALTGPERALRAELPETFLLGASRFIDYKRLDLVIRFGETVGCPVIIAGSGPLLGALREVAGSARVPVRVLERPSDAMLRALFADAVAFIYPPVEDFGIMPVEAYAIGTPAVVNLLGGAKEAAQSTGGGVATSFEDAAGWSDAFARALDLPGGFSSRAHALFSLGRFDLEIRSWLQGDAAAT